MCYNTDTAVMILGSEDYDGLSAFFDEVLTSQHAYKVAMARRCFNLCHILKGGECLSEGCEVITDNALQLYVDDFADHYVRHGCFPSVLLFDDVLLYGRAVYNALYRTEALLFAALVSRGVDAGRHLIHQKLIAAVDVRVYAMGDTDDVIYNSYLYRVSCAHRRYGFRMLLLSRRISKVISQLGGANTSHLLSAQIERHAISAESWSRLRLVWDHCVDHDAALVNCSGETLRAVHLLGYEDGRARGWATGFPVVLKTPKEVLNRICADLVQSYGISAERNERLVRILVAKGDAYAGYKMSLLTLIDSAESLRQLSCDMGNDWDEVVEHSDLARICRNFGRGSDLYALLVEMLHDADGLSAISQAFRSGSECVAAHDLEPHDERTDEAIAIDAENLLCMAGMQSEVDAFDFGHNLRTFVPLAKEEGMVAYATYLSKVGQSSRCPDIRSIVYEMTMLRHGINSMRYDVDASGDEVDCFLKAGELSTHAFPMRHVYALAALARVERAMGVRPFPLEQMLDDFVRHIPEEVSDVAPDDVRLQDLMSNLGSYAKRTYRCNKSIARWQKVAMAERERNHTSREADKAIQSRLLAYARRFIASHSVYA